MPGNATGDSTKAIPVISGYGDSTRRSLRLPPRNDGDAADDYRVWFKGAAAYTDGKIDGPRPREMGYGKNVAHMHEHEYAARVTFIIEVTYLVGITVVDGSLG